MRNSICPESIRWLNNNGRQEEARKTLEWAAKMNKIELKTDILVPPDVTNDTCVSPPFTNHVFNEFVQHADPGFKIFLENKIIRRWTLNLMFNWAVNALVFYGITIAAHKIAEDLKLADAVIFLSLIEVPAILGATWAMMRLPRRHLLGGLMISCGIFCIISFILHDDHHDASIVMAVIAKGCVAASYAIIYTYTIEIFPTVIRGTGLGLCTFGCQFGATISPFMETVVCLLANSCEPF